MNAKRRVVVRLCGWLICWVAVGGVLGGLTAGVEANEPADGEPTRVDPVQVDLTQVERTIAVEPTYQESPRYLLLVFGERAAAKVWVVLDGKRAFVDRNGNGDLTESDELVTSSGSTFSLGAVTGADGREHPRLGLTRYSDDEFRLSINLASGCRQTVGYGKSSYGRPRFARTAAAAPIVHLNGPMTFARYGPISILPRVTTGHSYRKTWLRIFTGSPGLGAGTFAGYNCKALKCESGYRDITADIQFAHQDPMEDPIRLRQRLGVKG